MSWWSVIKWDCQRSSGILRIFWKANDLLKDSFDEQWDFEKEVVCDTIILLPNLVNPGWKINLSTLNILNDWFGAIFCHSAMHAHWSTASTHMPCASLSPRFVSCITLPKMHFISTSPPFLSDLSFKTFMQFSHFLWVIKGQKVSTKVTNSFFVFLFHLFDNFLSPIWFMVFLMLFIF